MLGRRQPGDCTPERAAAEAAAGYQMDLAADWRHATRTSYACAAIHRAFGVLTALTPTTEDTAMDLRVLFIVRNESYEGENAPEALLVVDEFTYADMDPAYWERLKREALEKIKNEVQGAAEVVITVDQQAIRERCLNRGPRLEGKVRK